MVVSIDNAWPALPYEEFQSTGYLLHMCTQAIGKLKLLTPFEPQWANVALWVTTRGLTTGPIPYEAKTFSVVMDLIDHQIICMTSDGLTQEIKLGSMSVAELVKNIFAVLHSMDIKVTVNQKPQEIPDPILFDQDKEIRHYQPELAHAWWQILLNTQKVMQIYHATFLGKTQPIGFMWGTFDLRDARYNCVRVEPTGANTGYLRRNAMNEALIEAGWWSGNAMYPRAAYYSFTYPQPEGIENKTIQPAAARWDAKMGLFILDYDDLRQMKNPAENLVAFLQSTYQAGAELAGWDPKLVGSGEPEKASIE